MIIKWGWTALLLSFAVAQRIPSPDSTPALSSDLPVATELPLVATEPPLPLSDSIELQVIESELLIPEEGHNPTFTEPTIFAPPHATLLSENGPTPSETLLLPEEAVELESVVVTGHETDFAPHDNEPAPVAPASEFLSFSEWREKYAALPETAKRDLARKAKKGAIRPRTEGTTVDGGDGTEIGSLFAVEGDLYEPMVERASIEGVGAELAQVAPLEPGQAENPVVERHEEKYPLQPLGNVGAGDATDPLLSLKDRSNYALFDCAAKVHRSSPQTKGASSILVEKKDRYMLTPCAAKMKFVELELCEEIRIDTIVLANFEFFSSMFKHFSIKVSMHYPGRVDEWHDLGTFRARNSRGVQVFNTNKLNGWYRYMRVDFNSHYGSEYYCPVSLLRVYGITQMDKFRQEQEEEAATLEAAREKALMIEDEEDDSQMQPVEGVDTVATVDDAKFPLASDDAVNLDPPIIFEPTENLINCTSASNHTDSPPFTNESTVLLDEVVINSCSSSSSNATITVATSLSESIPLPTPSTPSPLPESNSIETSATSVLVESPPTAAESHQTKTDSEPTSISTTSTSTSIEPATTSIKERPANDREPEPSVVIETAIPTIRPQEPSSILATQTSIRASHRNETRPPIPPILPISPHSSDSIYGAITKRLAGLEHNHTLALNYIEAQSSMIRSAFLSIEQRLADFSLSAKAQNLDIALTLRNFELDRIALDRDRLELAQKVNVLAQEVQMERRLGIAQLLGLLALFVAVGVTRGSRPASNRNVSIKDDADRQAKRVIDDKRFDEERQERNAEVFRQSFAATARATPHKVQRRFSIPRRQVFSKVLRPWTPPSFPTLTLDVFDDDELGNATAKKSRSKAEQRSSNSLSSPPRSPSSTTSSRLSRRGDVVRSRWTETDQDATIGDGHVYLSVSEDDGPSSASEFDGLMRASQTISSKSRPPRAQLPQRPSTSPSLPTQLPLAELPIPPPEPILVVAQSLKN